MFPQNLKFLFLVAENVTIVTLDLNVQDMSFVSDTNLLHIDANLMRKWKDPRLVFNDADPCQEFIDNPKMPVYI